VAIAGDSPRSPWFLIQKAGDSSLAANVDSALPNLATAFRNRFGQLPKLATAFRNGFGLLPNLALALLIRFLTCPRGHSHS